jgi:hypothetical protein
MSYKLKDDFKTMDTDVWFLKRLKKSNWKITKHLDRQCIRITVRKGDYQMKGNDGKLTERAELTENNYLRVPTGTPMWYSFHFCFPKDFLIVDNRLVFAQWKQSTVLPESPFLSFRYVDGKLYFQIVYDQRRKKFFCDKKDWRGRWHKVLIYYKLDSNFHGETKAWLDDKFIADYEGRLGSSQPTLDPYFKMGLYRDRIEKPQTIYLSHFRRSTNRKFCE